MVRAPVASVAKRWSSQKSNQKAAKENRKRDRHVAHYFNPCFSWLGKKNLAERDAAGIRLKDPMMEPPILELSATPSATPMLRIDMGQKSSKIGPNRTTDGPNRTTTGITADQLGITADQTPDLSPPKSDVYPPGETPKKRNGNGARKKPRAQSSKVTSDPTPTSSVERARAKARSTGNDGKGTSSMNAKPLDGSQIKQYLGRLLEAAEKNERRKLPRREVAEREHKELDEQFEKRQRLLLRQGKVLRETAPPGESGDIFEPAKQKGE